MCNRNRLETLTKPDSDEFMQLFVFADLVRRNTLAQVNPLMAQILIHIQNAGSFNHIVKQVTYDLVIHGRPLHQPPLLWRI